MNEHYKNDLKALLGKGIIDDVIKALLKITNDENGKNEVSIISNQYEILKEKQRKGTINHDDQNRTTNQIVDSLIQIIDNHLGSEDENENAKSIDKKARKVRKRIGEINTLFQESIEIVEEEISKGQTNSKIIFKIHGQLQKSQQKCENQIFQIAVMALVKSGKSTFLNALMGNEFLPMSNVPETAVTVKIRHSEENKTGLLKQDEMAVAQGEEEIIEYLREINTKRRGKNKLAKSSFSLLAPLKILENKEFGQIKFEILDTPGFGEAEIEILKSKGKTLQKTNEELIEEIGVIIYLLDYTKLKTSAEQEVINKLSSMRQDLLENVQERLFFIINKIDLENRTGLSPEKTIDYVFNLVQPKVNKIKRSQIFTTSSSDALLARLILSDKASEDAKTDFKKNAFGRRYKRVTDEDLKEEAVFMLEDSAFPIIEDKIISFIYENRMKILFNALLTDLQRQISEFKNKVIETAIGTLNSNKATLEELELKMEEAKKKSDEIDEKSSSFESELKIWIKNEFDSFKKKASKDINSVFEEQLIEDSKFGLKQIKNKIKIFLGVESEKDNIVEKVESLNNEIFAYLQSEFTAFKSNLELKIVNKQQDLFEDLRIIINRLATEFEDKLKKSLKIDLRPIGLKLEDIDTESILIEVNKKIDRFINQREKEELVEELKSTYHSGSWCEDGYYTQEKTWKKETVQEYEVSKDRIQRFWLDNIDDLNNNANNITERFVDSYIRSQIRKAKRTFNEYVNDYLVTMREEERKIEKGGKGYVDKRLEELVQKRELIDKILVKGIKLK